MASSKQVVGNPTPSRRRIKSQRRSEYAADVTVPECSGGNCCGAPSPPGRLNASTVSQALALGVHAVVTGEDCTGLKIGRRLYDMPILADGEVRFIGEKVAAVAAE